jgi:hypothetical protein
MLPGENRKRFHSFEIYRDLEPHERNISAVMRALNDEGTPLSVAQLNTYARAGQWTLRAKLWDSHRQAIRTAAKEAAIAEEAAKWAREREQQRYRELSAGKALIAKAQEMLQSPIYEEHTENGPGGEIRVLLPAKWTFADAARLADIGTKLVRLAADMAQSKIHTDITIQIHEMAREMGIDPAEAAEVADLIARGKLG